MSYSNNDLKKSLEDRANKLHNKIIQSQLVTPEQIRGCSEAEIAEIEQKYKICLPYSYKVFLRHFGHGFAHIGNEFKYLYEDALFLTQEERNIEREIKEEENFNPEELLPVNAFVFAIRQDIQIWYFIAEEGIDDPPVFYDTGGDTVKMHESIFDFWEERVSYAEQLLAKRKEQIRQNKEG